MKKILLLLTAVLVASSAIAAKPKELRLIADSPRECLKSSKCRLVCDGNNLMIVPNRNEKHTRFTLDKQFDRTGF